ncbi:hypothetical protein DFH28DRAFT_961993 [Melampsora americana]|nr:hypothetical protein DFH28DRAFT_961993 [Melampsora americana]
MRPLILVLELLLILILSFFQMIISSPIQTEINSINSNPIKRSFEDFNKREERKESKDSFLNVATSSVTTNTNTNVTPKSK